MVILLSLTGAVCAGVGNFIGGMATKKLPATVVSFIAWIIGIPIWALLCLVIPSSPSVAAAVWGVLAGVTAGIGVILMLTALGRGRMTVVAPIIGAVAAGIPVLFDLARGNRQSSWTSLGLVLLIVAVVLITSAESHSSSTTATISVTQEIILAITAGIGLAFGFICINQAPKSGGAFTLGLGDVADVLMMIPIIWKSPKTWIHRRDGWLEVFIVSLFFPLEPLLFFIATHRGSISVAAVVVSVSPVFTLILAVSVLRERIRSLQIIGVLCCLSGLALVAAH